MKRQREAHGKSTHNKQGNVYKILLLVRVRVCVFFLAKQPPPPTKTTLKSYRFRYLLVRVRVCIVRVCRVLCGAVSCFCGVMYIFPAVRPGVHYIEASLLSLLAVSVRRAPHTGQ